jgi:murein DD-endopeptidase MepM/ murein hydrolase activator NlpD
MHDPDRPRVAPSPGGLSRRRLLTGAAASVGVFATWRAGVALADVSRLGNAASAVQPAERLDVPPFVPAPSTTVPFEPPAPGEILFPLALGTEWTCYVIDNFGDTRGRCCGYYHRAVDIMADLGTPQMAVVDGVLSRRHEQNTFGWTLDGDDGSRYRYFHNTADPAGWTEGDRVRQGDVIGFVGDSGTSAGNYHLHFEYYPVGQPDTPADPFHLLQRVPGATFAS